MAAQRLPSRLSQSKSVEEAMATSEASDGKIKNMQQRTIHERETECDVDSADSVSIGKTLLEAHLPQGDTPTLARDDEDVPAVEIDDNVTTNSERKRPATTSPTRPTRTTSRASTPGTRRTGR